jgi:hypothetical protein
MYLGLGICFFESREILQLRDRKSGPVARIMDSGFWDGFCRGESMVKKNWNTIFTPEKLKALFPEDRADAFFDALFGDTSEGAYDIRLDFRGERRENLLDFAFVLDQRPGKCLVCSLTYGLPDVFNRHPVINIKNLVADIEAMAGNELRCVKWELGATREVSRSSHEIPLRIELQTT